MKNHFLIVDDDALVRRATARLVEHVTGCEVECCASGEEALKVLKNEPDAFACVVTDFEMPGMNGLELGSRLHAVAPEVRMLLVTGSPGAVDGADARRRGFDGLLAKPFDLAIMKEALLRVLPPLNNSPVSRSHDLNKSGASFFERLPGTLRAAI